MNLCKMTAIAALTACGAVPMSVQADTIADVVASSGGEFDRDYFDYDLLFNALDLTGLDEVLDDEDGEFTVFAPNDLAFVRLARSLGFTGWNEGDAFNFIAGALADLNDGDAIGPLTDVLLYHVAAEEIDAVDFLFRGFFHVPVETVQGETFQPFFFRLKDNEPTLPDARLFFPINVQTDNGIIHTISRVLIPGSLLP